MYYYSKKSGSKIIHTQECFHIGDTDINDIVWFETLNEAYEKGYRLCKHCSPIAVGYRRENKSIMDFCKRNGLSVCLYDRFISVISPHSIWKIIVCDDGKKISLYHKNTFETEKDSLSEIKGYHKQRDISKDNVVDYLAYILKHDQFRMINPVYNKVKKEKAPPRKGTKRYRSKQRRTEKYKRKQAIKNVLNLIETLQNQSAPIQAAM